ncbi:hypothetical protein NDU88_000039 [Pleurodeles waltl]|uniref:Uncharacterized protein n=1 Tax=Pleurodeles waltl TaxID=8319 RepID=A0AAV7WEA0_PLEWA|nr:hypothetical protein NDU88_000039 [Pleurodeles waltl]
MSGGGGGSRPVLLHPLPWGETSPTAFREESDGCGRPRPAQRRGADTQALAPRGVLGAQAEVAPWSRQSEQTSPTALRIEPESCCRLRPSQRRGADTQALAPRWGWKSPVCGASPRARQSKQTSPAAFRKEPESCCRPRPSQRRGADTQALAL